MRIWFNHWFSTAYNLIKQLKDTDNTLTIIGSSYKDFMPYNILCDEWYKEPTDELTYIDWCINFCKEKTYKHKKKGEKMALSSKLKDAYQNVNITITPDKIILKNKQGVFETLNT